MLGSSCSKAKAAICDEFMALKCFQISFNGDKKSVSVSTYKTESIFFNISYEENKKSNILYSGVTKCDRCQDSQLNYLLVRKVFERHMV